MTPALAALGISIRLGGRAVLRGVSLEVARGEVLGVFGPTGAGKSTLFGVIAGEIRHQTGEVRLAGVEVSAAPMWERARRGLGYVPQGPSVLFDLTVAENLRSFARLSGRGDEALGWAPRVQLGDRLGVRASALSGGERRRLEVARALLAAPQVLLCDEPFAGLSPAAMEDIATLLRSEADRGLAVIVSDHHVDEALKIADRACLMLDGAIELIAPAAGFTGHPKVAARYTARRP